MGCGLISAREAFRRKKEVSEMWLMSVMGVFVSIDRKYMLQRVEWRGYNGWEEVECAVRCHDRQLTGWPRDLKDYSRLVLFWNSFPRHQFIRAISPSAQVRINVLYIGKIHALSL